MMGFAFRSTHPTAIGIDAMTEDHRQRAQRYLDMAQTARDPHIANGLRLLAAAYLEMAEKKTEPAGAAAGDQNPAR
jgi:hypothetical protein